MGTVKEEVLARVHFDNGASANDRACWILVKPAGPADSAGHSKVFELVVIDAGNGKVVWAGGEMLSGGGRPLRPTLMPASQQMVATVVNGNIPGAP